MADWIAQNYVIVIITIGTMLLGLVTGILGMFNILRKQALTGDALSHAALPGIVLAFMVTQTKNLGILLIGAAMAAIIAMGLLELIKKYSKIKYDASLALILSSFFGLGQILLLIVQGWGDSSAAGLNSFIFGQAATMLISDVYLIGIISIIVLLIILVLWKEFKLFVFNSEFYQSLGFSRRLTTAIINILTVIVVTISIRTIGVILMSALLIAPGVASRQWSNRLHINALLAGLFGMVSGAIGANISASVTNLSTGPVIVVVLSSFVLISLLFAPKRGIVNKSIADFIYKKQINKYHDLIHMYQDNEPIKDTLKVRQFIEEGLINYTRENKYTISEKGNKKVESLLGGRK